MWVDGRRLNEGRPQSGVRDTPAHSSIRALKYAQVSGRSVNPARVLRIDRHDGGSSARSRQAGTRPVRSPIRALDYAIIARRVNHAGASRANRQRSESLHRQTCVHSGPARRSIRALEYAGAGARVYRTWVLRIDRQCHHIQITSTTRHQPGARRAPVDSPISALIHPAGAIRHPGVNRAGIFRVNRQAVEISSLRRQPRVGRTPARSSVRGLVYPGVCSGIQVSRHVHCAGVLWVNRQRSD